MEKTIGLITENKEEQETAREVFSGFEDEFHCRFSFLFLREDNLEECKKADAILLFGVHKSARESIAKILHLTEEMIFYRNICLIYPLSVAIDTDNNKNAERFDRGGLHDLEIERTWRTALDFSEEKEYNVKGLAYWEKNSYNPAWQRVLDAVRCEYPFLSVEYVSNDVFLRCLQGYGEEKNTFVCDTDTGCKKKEEIISRDKYGERISVITGKTNVALYTVYAVEGGLRRAVEFMVDNSFDIENENKI